MKFFKAITNLLAFALLIVAFSEFSYWTTAEGHLWARVREFNRLNANQFAFSLISLLLLVLTIVLLDIFNERRATTAAIAQDV